MGHEKQYTISFNGKCTEGNQDAVMLRFANLFGVNPEEVAGIFRGQSIFIKKDLNLYTLNQYRKCFSQIGAETEWRQQLKSDTARNENERLNSVICPKCQHRQQQEEEEEEECLSCGIIFKKYAERQDRLAKMKEIALTPAAFAEHKDNGDIEIEEKGKNSDYQRATTDIKFGMIALTFILLADGILKRHTIDIGYLPYFAINFFFVSGCWFLAKGKGLSPYLGILGLASLLGVAVLILLPDRNKSSVSTQPLLVKLAAVTIIILSCYKVYSINERKELAENFSAFSNSIADGRHIYPSGQFDELEAFSNETDEMSYFIDNGFYLLNSEQFSPNSFQTISDDMFSEFFKLITWFRYQQLLYSKSPKELPECLHDDNIIAMEKMFIQQIASHINESNSLGSKGNMKKVVAKWFFECAEWDTLFNVCEVRNFEQDSSVYDTLKDFDDFFLGTPLKKVNQLPFPPTEIASLSSPDDSILEFHFANRNNSEIGNRLLVMANYKTPYAFQQGNAKVKNVFVPVGGDIPSRFLPGKYFNMAFYLASQGITY